MSTAQLIVALDASHSEEARRIVTSLGEAVRFYKVGMQLYTAEGPSIVRELVAAGKDVFLDLKYHDIPNTVAAAVREAAKLKVSMLTVHASGGVKMMKAAAQAAREDASSNLSVLAVTVLTSIDEQEMNATGIAGTVLDQVVRLGKMAIDAGCAGVVSSAHEVHALRGRLRNDFLAVTPGVRPAGSAHGDQARVVTPAEAVAAGATHIVVGRPITAAPDPGAAAEKILKAIA